MDTEDMAPAWRQHLRLALLRALASPDECPGGRGHESLLTDLVNAVHIAADRDQVRAELVWLHAEGLVAADTIADALAAMILDKGRRVAEGRDVHAGVKTPNRSGALKSVGELLAASLKPTRPGA